VRTDPGELPIIERALQLGRGHPGLLILNGH